MPNATADLGAEVARRLAVGQPCWFLGIADVLVRDWWRDNPGSDPIAYTTTSWLGGTPPRVQPVLGWPTMAIEPLPAAFVGRFAKAGIDDASAAAAVAAALRLLSPGAAASVNALVRSVHPVEARGPGYDCSHSEPDIPFSVLVSIPHGERDAGLRLAESLLHEAMHLQLTLIERHAPVVNEGAGSGYSPWQTRERPVQGLLHGLYVFAAIHRWLSDLAVQPKLSANAHHYVFRRLAEIDGEVAEVASLGSQPGLTWLGRTMASHLIERVAGERSRNLLSLSAQAVGSSSGGR